uniref:Uncharacterized protein n=1 Tax=Myoviridae sp. ctqfO1 TaxID=2827710 RepID=A0A8S5T3C8_9CAUD|nr:MAG TPA: hypothetical protein [Myoviridae sp. ctqfO1]
MPYYHIFHIYGYSFLYCLILLNFLRRMYLLAWFFQYFD